MSENQAQYSADDCAETGCAMSLRNKVVVVGKSALPENHPGNLFFCVGGNGANPNPIGRSVFAVSLSTGEHCRWYRSDVIGTLKPELLPDSERLYLSQIRPNGNPAPIDPAFFGYCFLRNGSYSSGVPLRNAEEAVEYAHMQAPYQHRVRICDRDDYAVMEMADGNLVYPTPDILEEGRRQRQQEQTGGMSMS